MLPVMANKSFEEHLENSMSRHRSYEDDVSNGKKHSFDILN
jgi:hypothetical protein